MNSISSTTAAQTAAVNFLNQPAAKPSDQQLELREKFQDFVAGTFYKQMLKSLSQTLEKPAYFHGGYAEDVFQNQMDQQLAEDLASDQGASLSDQLYEAFRRNRRL